MKASVLLLSIQSLKKRKVLHPHSICQHKLLSCYSSKYSSSWLSSLFAVEDVVVVVVIVVVVIIVAVVAVTITTTYYLLTSSYR